MRDLVLSLFLTAGCSKEPEDTGTITDTDTDTDTDTEVDLSSCESQTETSIVLGRGVAGAFEPLEPGAQVGLAVAPQGGFGVTVLINTVGIKTSPDAYTDLVNMQLDTLIEGTLVGTFLQEGAVLLCQSDGSGGVIYGVVVGFDPNVYKTNDDLLALDGQAVDLSVTITDVNGASASVIQPVTIVVGY